MSEYRVGVVPWHQESTTLPVHGDPGISQLILIEAVNVRMSGYEDY